MNFLYRHRVMLGFVTLALAVAVAFGMCFVALSRTTAQARRLTVVVDAGHGGVDGGVVGVTSGKKESDINLEIARLLQASLEEAGLCVVQTRPTQAGLYGAATPGYKRRDMEKRAEIISDASPAAVISVHQNFFSQSSRRGAQVFFREDLAGSKTLACAVQTALNGMPECVKKTDALVGDYFILNCSSAPAIIVECGFLSNPEDERLLLDGEYRRRIADTVTEGLLAFLATGAARGTAKSLGSAGARGI